MLYVGWMYKRRLFLYRSRLAVFCPVPVCMGLECVPECMVFAAGDWCRVGSGVGRRVGQFCPSFAANYRFYKSPLNLRGWDSSPTQAEENEMVVLLIIMHMHPLYFLALESIYMYKDTGWNPEVFSFSFVCCAGWNKSNELSLSLNLGPLKAVLLRILPTTIHRQNHLLFEVRLIFLFHKKYLSCAVFKHFCYLYSTI